ncbi:hypothetical protein HO133_000702 [Letharia lupina]|uniref:Uncharacterized protein n=1 Tax=Letharia lupina TaxID=560253 RepID=A0A8H6CFY3_9LECA|nr:uncharacterized protein HO133_000702 [Letharia lupina]KAF6222655.1 hypothetical protein HO133_000702 [Letharia lupina]
MERLATHKVLARIQATRIACPSATKVNLTALGNWCCAGAAGQGLGGPNCCDTNLTTSLAPYPFSTIDKSGQSTAASSSGPSSTAGMTSISSRTTLKSTSSPSISLGTSVQLTSQTSVATSTQTAATPSKTSTSLPSPRPTDPSHISKTGIEVGIPIATVVVLLAILAFFIFQNRKFKQRLFQLRSQMSEGSLRRGEARPEMHEREGGALGELDLTHYELTQHDAPKHELLGSEIRELDHNGIPAHELVGDNPPR